MRNIKEILKKIDEQSERGFSQLTYSSVTNTIRFEYEREEYLKGISLIEKRIIDILKVANYALNKGMNLVNLKSESHMFFSDPSRLNVGFIVCPVDDELYIGINFERSLRPTNIYTNGKTTFGYNRFTHKIEDPFPYDIKEILDSFDRFEESFYNYVDKQCSYVIPDGIDKEAVIQHIKERKEKQDDSEGND